MSIWFKRLLITCLILLFSGLVLVGAFAYTNYPRYFQPLVQSNGQTNILILGLQGFDRPDANLTDTLIVVNINRPTKTLSLVSLPRDIWVESIKAKVNTAYHYGGFPMAKSAINEVTGLTIDYVVVVDFSLFKTVIDRLGGVVVNVSSAFTDDQFPIPGKENDLCNGDKTYRCRYETIVFKVGPQLMSGETALKYVRSRHAAGDEGTDFARSRRQQEVIIAIKNRLLSADFYTHPQQISTLITTTLPFITTDFATTQLGSLVLELRTTDYEHPKQILIPEDLLQTPKSHYSKQWVLVPKSGSWADIQKYLTDQLVN